MMIWLFAQAQQTEAMYMKPTEGGVGVDG